MIVSGFRAVLDVDMNPLSNLICPRCTEQAKPDQAKSVLIMHIGFFRLFLRHITRNAVVTSKSSRYFSFPCSTEAVGIAHKPPHSL